MRRILKRTVLPLAFTLLAACGSPEPSGSSSGGTFEATVEGDATWSGSGDALFDVRANQVLLFLEGADGDFTVDFSTADLPDPGTHPFLDADQAGHNELVFYTGGGTFVTDGVTYQFGGNGDGTFTIDRADDSELSGSLDIPLLILTDDQPGVDLHGTLHATFTAAPGSPG